MGTIGRTASPDGEATAAAATIMDDGESDLGMRPATHDDPNAIPRNGTDVPWLELDDPSHERPRTRSAQGRRERDRQPRGT